MDIDSLPEFDAVSNIWSMNALAAGLRFVSRLFEFIEPDTSRTSEISTLPIRSSAVLDEMASSS